MGWHYPRPGRHLRQAAQQLKGRPQPPPPPETGRADDSQHGHRCESALALGDLPGDGKQLVGFFEALHVEQRVKGSGQHRAGGARSGRLHHRADLACSQGRLDCLRPNRVAGQRGRRTPGKVGLQALLWWQRLAEGRKRPVIVPTPAGPCSYCTCPLPRPGPHQPVGALGLFHRGSVASARLTDFAHDVRSPG